MTELIQAQVTNWLLRRLSEEAFDHLARHLQVIQLPVRHSLVRPQESINGLCFLESGLASVVAESNHEKSAEVRQMGHEGVTGHEVILGVDRTPNHTFMQVAGNGFYIPSRHFLPVLNDTPTRLLFLRYVHTCELQLAHSALAAAKFTLNQRLARWLLMCHDRMGCNDLPLTHEFLALMLGVRRSGVTDHLHILEGMQAIRSIRGVVQIRDREALIEIAGGCYGTPEQEYERLMDPVRRIAGNKTLPPLWEPQAAQT
jgi:CRP-like cAMP-binding protein